MLTVTSLHVDVFIKQFYDVWNAKIGKVIRSHLLDEQNTVSLVSQDFTK